jgi:hypothetical protein
MALAERPRRVFAILGEARRVKREPNGTSRMKRGEKHEHRLVGQGFGRLRPAAMTNSLPAAAGRPKTGGAMKRRPAAV